MQTRKYSLCGAGTVVPVDVLTWQGQQQRKGVVRSGKPDKHANPSVPLGIKRKIKKLIKEVRLDNIPELLKAV